MKPQDYAKLKKALSANRGGLHRRLHIPMGKRIPANVLAKARRARSPIEREEANLATTARGFKH